MKQYIAISSVTVYAYFHIQLPHKLRQFKMDPILSYSKNETLIKRKGK
jgi:hypothetical protein